MHRSADINMMFLVGLVCLITSQVASEETGVYLSLGGGNITNNSYVNINNIGSDGTSGLLCHTNKIECCTTINGSSEGNWYYPNGSIVDSEATAAIYAPFSSTRDQRVIQLFRINSSMETGNFHCIIPDASGVSHTLYVNIFSIQISDGGIPPVVGQSYSLNCVVSTNVTSYRWTTTSTTFQDNNAEEIMFPMVILSNAGQYTCEVEIIVGSIIYKANSSHTLFLQIPSSITITTNSPNPIHSTELDIELTCTVSLRLNHEELIPVTVNVSWIGPHPDLMRITDKMQPTNNNIYNPVSNYSSTAIVNLFRKEDSGNYTCAATVESREPYVNVTRVTASKQITTGVFITINQRTLPNNSVIADSELQSSLICHTDKQNCCSSDSSYLYRGQWYSPVNGTIFGDAIPDEDGTLALNLQGKSTAISKLCCKIPDFSDTNQTVCISLSALSIIVIGDAQPGQNYSLTCIDSSRQSNYYQWRKDGTPLNETGSTLSFSPLRLSDAGRYSCNSTYTKVEHQEITLQIPAPYSINLSSNKANPIQLMEPDVILTCTVKLSGVVVESNVTKVEVQLIRNGARQNLTGPTIDATNFTYTTTLSSFGRSDSGNYICNATVIPDPPTNTHLTVNGSVMDSIQVSTGVFLSMNGRPIDNMSTILINKIGEKSDETLLCSTDLYPYFNDSEDLRDVGQWYFPNRSAINTSGDIYIGREQGVVQLHRRNGTVMPTGMFRCQIPDFNQIPQDLYVHLRDNENMPTTSVVGAVASGAVIGGLLLLLVGTLFLTFLLKKLRGRSEQSKNLSHTRGFSEPLEAIDSTKLPPETEGECIELDECDGIDDKDGESKFIDTTLTDGEFMKPIPVSEFCNHVEQLHVDRDKLFETEYTRISRLPKFCTSEAKLSYNAPKNRFANILPYDCSRVKLTEIEGKEGSDYINANHLDGYNKPKAYIAAQGPLPNTVGDFWRMIWENELSTIVMLTKCFEGRVKCEEYWPVNVGESISPCHDLTITLTAVLPFTDYSIRKMIIIHSGAPDSTPQEVIQFHFLGWPDHGVPQNGVVLINFIRRVRTIHPYSDPRPLLVHCSAGVGRTGAFIVLDSMLERMKKEDNLNIFEFLKQLRAQRVLMVQTQAQYNFIHDVLNELILTGDTEINAPNLRIVMNRLYKIKDGETGFSKQFKILDQVSPIPCESDYTQANMEYNAGKNRYPHIKPNDHHRVLLRELAGSGLDYINASFINGYRQRGTYIATQVPMENTVNDFWKMIWEYKSKTIVVLCKMAEDGETYHDFLPVSKGSSMMYGKIGVKFVSQQVSTDYTVKQVELSEDRGTDKHDEMTVTLFHYLRWPKNGSPQRTASLLEVIELVNKKQMSSGNKAITVMCNDGVGRTGTFICIHAQLERLKNEGVVDFFQSIKSARIQRAGLVPDVDQYVLCHTVVADFLNDFDAYANFKDLI